MQDAIKILADYWTQRGCLTVQPFNTEVGAGTMNPATVLRVLGPEQWNVAYVEPSVRPDDSRYGENPNRLQTHTQYQVILKPEPGDPQQLYLGSLEALGIDLRAHDVRFVEDNWAQPAIGAWGLGWEVWLDGMEITQFTYFQQVGGVNLDPIPVELTYGMERILMALQGVTHFKDITYAPGISYGEAFGQSEYEMSRYYLDDADVATNQKLYELYVAEAQRMVDARLPVPAHSYILKSSHAFNVLDARGAISTTERAKAFATMRTLAREVSHLWIARRDELGLPLLKQHDAAAPTPAPLPDQLPSDPQTLVVEIGAEELPPHVVTDTVEQVRQAITEKLGRTRLAHGSVTVDATPRRVVVTVEQVAAGEPDAERVVKGPKWAAAFDGEGNPSKALEGFLRGQQASADWVVRETIGGVECAALRVPDPGRPVMQVLPELIAEVISGLRAVKNMRWCDPGLSFSRPVRWLVALWGPVVVPVVVSDLVAGRTSYGHRTDTPEQIEVETADAFAAALAERGIVVNYNRRRDSVLEQARQLAVTVGGHIDPDADAAVIDEITNLVEQPHGIVGSFDPRYLDLPSRILTTVMRKHQRYLPVYDSQGGLLPHFVTMANGDCDDAVVRAGNESVLRARYEDALFFWNTDLKTDSVETFVPGLAKLTFADKLGSMADRARRIATVATTLAERVGLDAPQQETLQRAGQLAKFDLATDMVVEMSSLAGFIAREYALRKGETPQVADALAQMEQPHTSADELPGSTVGALLALADRLDLITAMFALGAKPTGSSDPFGLRRASIGVVRILRDDTAFAALGTREGLEVAAQVLREQGVEVADATLGDAQEFIAGRFAQLLRDEGVAAELVSAIAPAAVTPHRASQLLAELDTLLNSADFSALVTLVNRIDRIVSDQAQPQVDQVHLSEPAEKAVVDQFAALQQAQPQSLAEYTKASVGLVAATNDFFEAVLINAEDSAVRTARHNLLASMRALVPADVDWAALDIALGTGR